MKSITFNHINDCWNYLEQFNTVDEMKKHLGDLPSKFGSFEITNESSVEDDGFIELCNSYFNEQYDDYEYTYNSIPLEN